jgi:hypothetical protein
VKVPPPPATLPGRQQNLSRPEDLMPNYLSFTLAISAIVIASPISFSFPQTTAIFIPLVVCTQFANKIDHQGLRESESAEDGKRDHRRPLMPCVMMKHFSSEQRSDEIIKPAEKKAFHRCRGSSRSSFAPHTPEERTPLLVSVSAHFAPINFAFLLLSAHIDSACLLPLVITGG